MNLVNLSLKTAVAPEEQSDYICEQNNHADLSASESSNQEVDENETIIKATSDGPFNAIIIEDNGKGMSPLELHRMMSFGHCDKV